MVNLSKFQTHKKKENMKLKEMRTIIKNSECNFAKLAKKENNPTKRVRLLGMQMVKDGKRLTHIAATLGMHYTTIKAWIKRFIKRELDGLKDLPGRGQKPFFPRDQRDKLAEQIEMLQQKKNGGRTTGKDIQKLLKEKWNVEYGLGGVYCLMEKYKIVWITGRSKHPKSDLARQEEFKKNSKMRSNLCCQIM